VRGAIVLVGCWALLFSAVSCADAAVTTTASSVSVSSTEPTSAITSTSGSTSAPSTTTSGSVPSLSTTTSSEGGGERVATRPFSVPVGENGVTYDLAGSPPSGPSSFVVLDDGSVVIADTMAVKSGQPRLLRFDAQGVPMDPIMLADAEVASVVDVASDGRRLALLDVYVAQGRYRVLVLDPSGGVKEEREIPEGLRFEAGLSGLVWDDSGVLLEYEGGVAYARIGSPGEFEPTDAVVFGGTPISVKPGEGLTTSVEIGSEVFAVPRSTMLGGATLIGRAPDGTILLSLDEVEMTTDGAIKVTRRILRYSPTGELLGETPVDLEQFVDVPRLLEMTADGQVAQLVTLPERVELRILDIPS